MEHTFTTPLLFYNNTNEPFKSSDRRGPSHSSSEQAQDENESNVSAGSIRRLGVFDGVALVLGMQIGSGIFVSPSLVARNAQSEPATLLIWLAAGLLAWACAACYIELGTRFPVNGGPQEYLTYCFSELCGVIASWTCIFVVKACSTSILALAIGEYICEAIDMPKMPFDAEKKLVAFIIIATATILNCTENKTNMAVAKIMLLLKILSVAFVLAMGLVYLVTPTTEVSASNNFSRIETMQGTSLTKYSDAMLSAVWAYSGWETLAFIGGEVKNPSRNTSLVVNISMICVIVLSLLANVTYFCVLSFEDVTNKTSVGLTFCKYFFGSKGSLLYAAIICISAFGSLNVKVYTGARLSQAAAERKCLPAIIQTIPNVVSESTNNNPTHVDSQFGMIEWLSQPIKYKDGTIPISAVIFNSALSIVYLLMGSLSSLIIAIGIADYSVALVTLVGLLSLRIRTRQSERRSTTNIPSFRVPIIVILIASAAAAFLVFTSIAKHIGIGLELATFCVASTFVYKRYVWADIAL